MSQLTPGDSLECECQLAPSQNDQQKPFCSKTTDAEVNDSVRWSDQNSCPLSQYVPEQGNFGLAFSDTVLDIIPKISNIDVENEVGSNPVGNGNKNIGSELSKERAGQSSGSGLITRKSPKVSIVLDKVRNKNENESMEDSEDEGDWPGRQVGRDYNNNLIEWSSHPEKKLLEHASYLFHEDRSHHLARTVSLLPRGREYVVFNVFHDVARLFGYRRRKKRVAFPKDVLQKYAETGDVAGKDRFVPTAKQAYAGVTTTKKRKLSAVYSSWTVKEDEFAPRIERIDDYSTLELCCERYCMACECCCGDVKKPDLTQVMEGFLSDLNVASLFIYGHATRTFESALSTLEFKKLHRFSYTQVTPASILQQNYSRQKLGVLSANIWIFGYCIRSIVQQANVVKVDNAHVLPSESAMRKILEHFASLCLTIMEDVKKVLQHSHNFYNFCAECHRILRIIQLHVGFKAELRRNLPLKRGAGLELNRKLGKWSIMNQKAVRVNVARDNTKEGTEDIPELEWKAFEDYNGTEKIKILRHLLTVTTDGINLATTQLRFLMDDIVDSVKDIMEADLLFILADMYDRVKFLENVGRKHVKAEMSKINELMTDFCKDFQAFVDLGQQIMKRFVELRDMIHITYEFIVKGLMVESLSEMLPGDAFKNKRSWCTCCGGKAKGRKRIVERHEPKYRPIDFFRVYYDDVIKKREQIYANNCYITLEWSNEKITTIFPHCCKPSNWGNMEDIRSSFDNEYVEAETDEEAPANVPTEVKPVLVGSPIVSPRGSIQSGGSSGETGSSPPENLKEKRIGS